MSKAESIDRHKVVTLQYSLTNANGVVVREAAGAPIRYLHGAGLLFPKLESVLQSHTVGDIVTARLLPDDAFGKRNVDLVHQLPIDELPPGETIEIGGNIVGTDEAGDEITFTVTDIQDGIVSLDGNHPFAGQSLIFEVEVQDVRAATAEEISQRRVLD